MKNKLTIYILSLQIEKEEPPPGALRTRLVGRVTLRSVLILVDIVCEYCFLKLNNSRKTNLQATNAANYCGFLQCLLHEMRKQRQPF